MNQAERENSKINKYKKLIDYHLEQADKYAILLDISKRRYKEITKPGFKLSYQNKVKPKIKVSEIEGIQINSTNLIQV